MRLTSRNFSPPLTTDYDNWPASNVHNSKNPARTETEKHALPKDLRDTAFARNRVFVPKPLGPHRRANSCSKIRARCSRSSRPLANHSPFASLRLCVKPIPRNASNADLKPNQSTRKCTFEAPLCALIRAVRMITRVFANPIHRTANDYDQHPKGVELVSICLDFQSPDLVVAGLPTVPLRRPQVSLPIADSRPLSALSLPQRATASIRPIPPPPLPPPPTPPSPPPAPPQPRSAPLLWTHTPSQ
jgi:hypothetical protein